MKGPQALFDRCAAINEKLQQITISQNYFQREADPPKGFEAYRNIIEESLSLLEPFDRERLFHEYFAGGPLELLLADDEVTEIIVNAYDSVWIERKGHLSPSTDTFLSRHTFQSFLDRLYLEIGQEPTLTTPFVDGAWRDHRLHIIGPYSAETPWVRLSVRKHKKEPWTLSDLEKKSWAPPAAFEGLREIVRQKKNYLVVGPTGSGKTSVLKALIGDCSPLERIVILEDSKEINPPNSASTHLLSRHDSRNILTPISLSDLVKQSLRMRPDRLVIGEVRGGEAKDLLLALATGHEGSAGTLHASDPNQALIRLEMLIQMGAPHWSLHAIRRLIQLSLDYLIVCQRETCGKRSLEGIYRIITVETSGLIIQREFF